MRRVWGLSHRSFSLHTSVSTGKLGLGLSPVLSTTALQARLDCYQQLRNKHKSNLPSHSITVTLPNGKTISGIANKTTPLEIAKSISLTLAKSVIVAKVQGNEGVKEGISVPDVEDSLPSSDTALWDLQRPLETDCSLQLLTWDSPLSKSVFWHSSAHILGAALEQLYGVYLAMGPALNPGFYYDAYMGSQTLNPEQFPEIELTMQSLIDKQHPFERLIISKEEALELFSSNPFKCQLIDQKVPKGHKTTAYRCGPVVDLCTGPHLPHTGYIKAFALVKNSSSYWLGDSQNDTLQRIYGVSFPEKKELLEHMEIQRKLAERDHHTIGRSQSLYFWHPTAAGSTFFLPPGTRIYNKLTEFIRRQYRCRGYEEVISPNMFSCELWKTSGHYQKYKEDMFILGVEGQEWGLKPMNCPAHCLMFDQALHTYKELPIRYADFGALHRNEASGALSGLTRVRRFQQDDAHIFCRKDQIMQEVLDNLDFLSYVYQVFGFEYELELSTRPKNALGSEELWKTAEEQLKLALDQFGKPWKLNPGDGAFYGPKIDIKVMDAMQRKHQCGTIQLDFNLPKRFNLQYKTDTNTEHEETLVKYDDFEEKRTRPGFERPVIIHRAILGSIERVMAVLAEHYAGKWPFWLSPRQIAILPVSEKFQDYALKVKTALELAGYEVETDNSNLTLRKKIRNAQLSQFNYIGVVGQEEVSSHTVDIRDRSSNASIGKYSLPALVAFLKTLEPPLSKAEVKLREMSESVQAGRREVDLQGLNSRLTESPFLGGTSPSSEDWHLCSSLSSPTDLGPYPNIIQWLGRLKS